ncbi:MAG: UbiA family prenyltransferase, partial [Candidatus Bathyarchaeota archaeon]|nr:UbiA family prenyltransferase [Candidatus Bathyarchaeota archaeon]
DALNNVYDKDLDEFSHPSRAEFTRRLGGLGLPIALGLCVLSVLGAFTTSLAAVFWVLMGIFFGVLYSVPPFRFRQTLWKPIVNFTVGAVSVLIVAAFSDVLSTGVMILVIVIGITTAVNSLWEDLADYFPDLRSGAKTVPVILGPKNGLLLTVALGYSLLPLMLLVGVLFSLPSIFYILLFGLATLLSARLLQNWETLISSDAERLLKLGNTLAGDFVIIAIIQTLNLMLSGYLRARPVFF